MPAILHSNDDYPDHNNEVTTTTSARHEIAQVIAISSGKGGVGKSTLTTNLGIALSKAGKKVCLLDADTNLANINILLGITPLHTLEHFFRQDLSLRDVIVRGPEGMDIIAGASGVSDFIQLSQAQQKKLITGIRSLEQRYQFLLIDTAAGIDKTNINLLLAAPYLILSITQEPTSLTDAFSLLRVLRKHHYNRSVLVIVNMAISRQLAKETFQRFKKAVKEYLDYKVYYAGYVLIDKHLPNSVLKQRPVVLSDPDSPASQCILKIGKRLYRAFDKRRADRSSLSDRLAEAAFLAEAVFHDDESELDEQREFVPAPEYQHTRPSPEPMTEVMDTEGTTRSSLLRASYFARLLAVRK